MTKYCLYLDGTYNIESELWTTQQVNLTITFWIRRVDPQRNDNDIMGWFEGVLNCGNYDSGEGWQIGWGETHPGQILPRFWLAQRGVVTLWGLSNSLDLWEWHHIAIVLMDGDSYINTRVYVDGVLNRERLNTIPKGAFPPTSLSLFANNTVNPVYPRRLHRSWVNEFRMWTKVLSQPEIQADMVASTPDLTSLVVWYPMNEGSGSVVHDNSGNNKDGTIGGTPIWEDKDTIPKYIFDDQNTINPMYPTINNQFWNIVNGVGSDETTEKKHGIESFKLVLSNQLLDIYRNYPNTAYDPETSRDFSFGTRIDFWMYGANTGDTISIEFWNEVYASKTNGYRYQFIDNFSGWQRISITKSGFTNVGTPLGWNVIKCVRIVGTSNVTVTYYFDQIIISGASLIFSIRRSSRMRGRR